MFWISRLFLDGTENQAEEDFGKMYISHCRNTTGVIGPKFWSDDEEINKLWEKYGKPISNGISINLKDEHVSAHSVDIPSVQQSFVRHVVTTLARTHFNVDSFAGYQAAAHT